MAQPTTHLWVEFQYLPVTVELNDEGHLDIYASEEGMEIAIDDKVYACWTCEVSLNPASFDTECHGKEGAKEVSSHY